MSLAIGKHGQNVRLASRLIGWELDIRTKETSGEAEQKKEKEEKKETEKEAKEAVSLESLPGVGEKTLANLKESGFNSLDDLLKADTQDLIKVKGIGEKKAQKIIEEARKLSKK